MPPNVRSFRLVMLLSVVLVLIAFLVIVIAESKLGGTPAQSNGGHFTIITSPSGDVDFIELNLEHTPHFDEPAIFRAFEQWSATRPDREIVAFWIEYRPDGVTSIRTDGIWIVSKKKSGK